MSATSFHELEQAGVPVTPREYLTLMEAIENDLAGRRMEEFYFARRWQGHYSMTPMSSRHNAIDRSTSHRRSGAALVQSR
jgi:uncharacterized protein with von Willebrand factor type A (vWA) domain